MAEHTHDLDLMLHVQYAETLGHMLDDLLCGEDGIPEYKDVNDPRSRSQRQLACLAAMQAHLGSIKAIVFPEVHHG